MIIYLQKAVDVSVQPLGTFFITNFICATCLETLTRFGVVVGSPRTFENVRVIMIREDEHTLVELGRVVGIGKEAWLGAPERVLGQIVH